MGTLPTASATIQWFASAYEPKWPAACCSIGNKLLGNREQSCLNDLSTTGNEPLFSKAFLKLLEEFIDHACFAKTFPKESHGCGVWDIVHHPKTYELLKGAPVINLKFKLFNRKRKAALTCATSQTFSMNTDATVSRMGVWPPGAGLQGQAPNHPMLLCLRGTVVSDGETADLSRQVSDEKMSKSEPLKTHRKVFQKLSKRAQVGGARKSVDVTCLRSTRQPVFRRHELIAGLDTERGNLTWGAKGKPQVAKNHEGEYQYPWQGRSSP